MSETFSEDMLANGILYVAGTITLLMYAFCKRVAQSDCQYDPEHGGLKMKLPTFRDEQHPRALGIQRPASPPPSSSPSPVRSDLGQRWEEEKRDGRRKMEDWKLDLWSDLQITNCTQT